MEERMKNIELSYKIREKITATLSAKHNELKGEIRRMKTFNKQLKKIIRKTIVISGLNPNHYIRLCSQQSEFA